MHCENGYYPHQTRSGQYKGRVFIIESKLGRAELTQAEAVSLVLEALLGHITHADKNITSLFYCNCAITYLL